MWLIALLLASHILLAVYAAGAFPWAACIAAAVLSCAGLVVSLRAARGSSCAGMPATLALPIAVYGLILLFSVLMCIPLPLALTRLSGPTRYMQNRLAAGTLEAASALGLFDSQPEWYALTRNLAGSLRTGILLIGAFSAGWLTVCLSARRRVMLLRGMLVLAVVIAAGAIAALTRYPQGATIWWHFPVGRILPGPIACFINRNHLAGYLAMLSPAALVLAVRAFETRRAFDGLVMLGAFAVLACAVVLTLSRGAILALGVAVIATVAILAVNHRRLAALLLLLGLTGALFAAPRLPLPALREKFADLRSANPGASLHVRAAAWRDAFEIWRTYPVLGAGGNAFRMVHPQIRRTTRSSRRTYAENEYVQLIADGGLIGVGLALAFFAVLVPRTRLIVRGPPIEDIVLATAGGAGFAAAAVHALVEFAPHVPLYAMSLGVLVACVLRPRPRVPPGLRPPPAVRRLAVGVAAAAFALALLASIWHREMLMYDSRSFMRRIPPARLAAALRWAPTSSTAWYRLGRAARRLRTDRGYRFAEACMTQSVVYDANNYRYWKDLGDLRLYLGDRPGAQAAYDRVRALRTWVRVPDLFAEDAPP
jgi:hypothetical protein